MVIAIIIISDNNNASRLKTDNVWIYYQKILAISGKV